MSGTKPGATHSTPSQPSPNESIVLRVQLVLNVTANGPLEAYGALLLSVVPPEQLRLQPSLSGYAPPEQVITEGMVEVSIDGGEGGEGAQPGA